MPKQLYAKAIEKMCALNYSNENYFNEQGFLLMKKFLSLLSIFAIIAMLFTSCEGGGGGGEGEEGTPVVEGVYLFPNTKPNAKLHDVYQGVYLDNSKKYDCYTVDKQTVYYVSDEGVSQYTVDEKNVRIGGETFILGYNKLTHKNGTPVLTKITPGTKNPIKYADLSTERDKW